MRQFALKAIKPKNKGTNMKTIIASLILALSLNANAGNRLTTDIVDTAVGAGSFKTLVAAVQAAGLVDTLKSEGPFTVFAPTDDAFAKLPDGTVAALLNDIPALTNILTYHVLAGEPCVKSLFKNKMAQTLQGQNLEFRKKNGKFFVNGSMISKVIKVKNGQILIIDSVMLPK